MTYKQIVPKCSLAGRRAIVKQGRDGGREVVIEEWAPNLMGRLDIYNDRRLVVYDLVDRILADAMPRHVQDDVENMVGCKVKPLTEGGPWYSRIYHVSELRLLDDGGGKDC